MTNRDTKYEQVPADIGVAVAVVPDDVKTPAGTMTSTVSKSGASCRVLGKFLLLLTLSTAILGAVLLGAIYHGGRRLAGAVGTIVVPRITSNAPLDLPSPTLLSEIELRDVERTLEEFHRLFHYGEAPAHDLVLTEREINGLLCSDHHHHHHHHHHDDSDGCDMCGKVHVTVSEHEVSADFSIPTTEDVPGGSGRYFVGAKSLLVEPGPVDLEDESYPLSYSVRSAMTIRNDDDSPFPLYDGTASVDVIDEGFLDVQFKSAQVFGWAATDAFVNRFFDGVNWAEGMSCPHAKAALKLIEGVDIGDGKVVVRLRDHGNGHGGIEDDSVDGAKKNLLRTVD